VMSQMRKFSTALLSRCEGPGGIYNIGNLIGLMAGVAFTVAAARSSGSSALASVSQHFWGDPGAAALTLAAIIFFVSGELYHRAYAAGATSESSNHLLRAADASSGVAALGLAVALVWMGDTLMALLSTALLASGKFGNALARSGQWLIQVDATRTIGRSLHLQFDAFRLAVPMSRLPAILGLTLELLRASGDNASSLSSLQSMVLLLCYLLWLRADSMLLALDLRWISAHGTRNATVSR